MIDREQVISKLKRDIVFFSSGKASMFALSIIQHLSELIKNDGVLCDEYECIHWSKVFKSGHTTFDSLLETITTLKNNGGYAVCILYPDDLYYPNGDTNGRNSYIARNNVIFEYGLCCGMLGINRTMYAFCESANGIACNRPSDIHDVKGFQYKWDDSINGPELRSSEILAYDMFNAMFKANDRIKNQDLISIDENCDNVVNVVNKTLSIPIVIRMNKQKSMRAPLYIGDSQKEKESEPGTGGSQIRFPNDAHSQPNPEQNKNNLRFPQPLTTGVKSE